MSEATPASGTSLWPDYRAVWRWHFYASLFCIPFVVILSISGVIYLFKPQIEAWQEWSYDHLQVESISTSPAEQVKSALAAVSDSTFNAYELPASPTAAGRVIVKQQGEAIRVYVHPETLAVLGTQLEDERFMRAIFRLHGELWLGDRGSNLVELAASWTIIMILTGLYLWWPRHSRGWGGVLYPRLGGGKRMFWRDLHSVTGFWISGCTLFLLLSGLPWAKSWGTNLKTVRQLTGTARGPQDWTTGSAKKTTGKKPGGDEHGGHGGGKRSGADGEKSAPVRYDELERVVGIVAPLNLPPPVVISPPRGNSHDWAAKSTTANRPLRVNLVVDGQTGNILSREAFADRQLIDQIVAVGIAAHEGQLFGWPNQLLGLLTALGLLLLCFSGLILWWRRRNGGLGAPPIPPHSRASWALVGFVVVLGIYLPMFGLSLLLVLLMEWILLRRIPFVRDWLGLTRPTEASHAQ